MAEPVRADVLPPTGNQVLAALWIVLFAGRWIAVPFLQAAGLVDPAQLTVWDEGPLLRCYTVLFVITMVVVALRAVRRSQPAPPTQQHRTRSDSAPEPGGSSASARRQVREERQARD